jgi:hypothetical protein
MKGYLANTVMQKPISFRISRPLLLPAALGNPEVIAGSEIFFLIFYKSSLFWSPGTKIACTPVC